MKKNLLALVLLLPLTLTACGDPCAGVTATERDRQAAADGYEVEKEGCELNEDGTWDLDD